MKLPETPVTGNLTKKGALAHLKTLETYKGLYVTTMHLDLVDYLKRLINRKGNDDA